MMGKILIVEDHRDAAVALKALFRHQGYAVEHVSSGEAALAALREGAPDLVILDLGLPGMDGLAVLREIRQDARLAKLPVIVFSALADDQRRPELLAAGANECWLKSHMNAVEMLHRVCAYVLPSISHPSVS